MPLVESNLNLNGNKVTNASNLANVYNVVSYGADPTGSTACDTIVNAIISALPTQGGVIYFPTGTYKVSTVLTALLAGTQTVTIKGDGASSTVLNYYGTGDCIRMYNSSAYGSGGAQSYFSGIHDLTIDGTHGTGSPVGLHAGDITAIQTSGLVIQNFTGTSSIGMHLDNTVNWTEQANIRAIIINCTRGTVLEVTTGTGSFGYCSFDFTFYQSGAQSCFCVINGAGFYHGSFKARGDIGGSATTLTGTPAFFYISGVGPGGSSASGESAYIAACKIDVMCEPNNNSGANTHFMQTFYLDSSTFGSINECYGMLDFAQGTGALSPIDAGALTATHGYFGNFSGIVNGDSALNPSGVLGWQSFGSGTLLNYIPGLSAFDGFFPTIQADTFTTTLDGSSSTVFLNYSGIGNGETFAGPQRKLFFIKQPATGGPYGLTWPTSGSPTNTSPTIIWHGGHAPSLQTAPNAVDVIEIVTYDGATWYGQCVSSGNGDLLTLRPSGDTSGVSDAAAITAAIATLTSSHGVVKLAPNAPWYINCGQISINGSGIYIDAEGCTINAVGSGDMIKMYDSSTYGSRTIHGGGVLGNPVVDGTSTTGAASALHIGDIFRTTVQISPQNFTITSSDGVIFDNQYYWTEKISANIYASNCYRGVRFTQNPAVPLTPTSTGSMMRSDLTIYINQGAPTFDGIVWEKGTYCPGSVLNFKGNFGGRSSVGALTSACIRVTGSSPTGSSDSSTFSNIQYPLLSVDFECSSFTYTPYQYVVDTSCTIANAFGNVNFATAGNNFRAGTGYFGFMGVSDTLPAQIFDAWLFQGVLAIGSYASASTLASSGTIATTSAWGIVAPTAAVTGVVMGSGLYDGQMFAVLNNSSFSITFAASGTSHVATGTAEVIPAASLRMYFWSGTTNLWYPVAVTGASFTGGTLTSYLAPAVAALTDGTSVALNAALGNMFTWGLGGASHTLGAPSNPVNGQQIVIDIAYSGTFTPLFNAAFLFGTDGAPTWTSTSGKTDTVAFRYSSAKSGWLCQGWKLGY